jgi:hypothetical protein
MESMIIILWSQAKDRQCSPGVTLGLILVLVPKKASDGEFTAFYPELRRFVDGGKGHESAVRDIDEAVRVVRIFGWTCGRFQFSVGK